MIPAPELALDHRLPKASFEEEDLPGVGLMPPLLLPPKEAAEEMLGLLPPGVELVGAAGAAVMLVK